MHVVFRVIISLYCFGWSLSELVCNIQNISDQTNYQLEKFNETCIEKGPRFCIPDMYSSLMQNNVKPSNLKLNPENKTWIISWESPKDRVYIELNGFIIIILAGFEDIHMYRLKITRLVRTEYFKIKCSFTTRPNKIPVVGEVCVQTLPRSQFRTQKKDYELCYNVNDVKTTQGTAKPLLPSLSPSLITHDPILVTNIEHLSGSNTNNYGLIGGVAVSACLILSVIIGILFYKHYRCKLKSTPSEVDQHSEQHSNDFSQSDDTSDVEIDDCPVHGGVTHNVTCSIDTVDHNMRPVSYPIDRHYRGGNYLHSAFSVRQNTSHLYNTYRLSNSNNSATLDSELNKQIIDINFR
ncbi:uncharacterized protein LOC134691496 [Mytilus trossulus]|uniref:uncharacterized protein LOC134691496 n=1 Tax=Mytilus trossulus TaxID=6551 RepID=UPI00300507F6